MRGTMRVTIKDIALRAGVSKTTVSFAFNDPEKISKETYARVMSIADELGYVPDPVARTLTTKRIGAIGLLLPQPMHEALRNPYLTELIQGIGAACLERDYSLLIVPPMRGRLEDAARRALVDALLAIGVGPDHSVVSLFKKRHIPLVTIDGEAAAAAANVGIDDEAAAFSLMRHVLGLGHRRLAVIELETETYHEPPARASMARDRRMAGFERALAMEGLSLDSPGISIHAAECSLEGGRACAERVLGPDKPELSAVVAMADIVALGFYEVCAARGIVIPRDLTVVAFDGIELGGLMVPPLTTLRQPGYPKGYEAAALLLSIMDGGRVRHITMESQLVVRGSSAPVPERGS